MVKAIGILENIGSIAMVYFDARDIVRHKLVKHIVNAFERYTSGNGSSERTENNDECEDSSQ